MRAASSGQLLRSGDTVLAGGEAPGMNGGVGGDIQGPLGLPAIGEGQGEQLEGLLRDRDPGPFPMVDGGDVAVLVGNGEQMLQLVDPLRSLVQHLLAAVTIGGELHHGVHGKYGRGGLPGLGAAGQQQGQHHGQEQESDRVHSVTSKDRDVLHTQ